MLVMGDTHEIKPIIKIINEKGIINFNIIHVGDLGLGELSIGQDVYNLLALDEFLVESNNHLYVIRGNHDNPIFWDKSLGLNLPKFYNLHLVEDYSVLNIEGKNILCIGGAISIDRAIRETATPYPIWWRGEDLIFDENSLDRILTENTIDIVVTHTAPHFCHPQRLHGVKIIENYHAIEKQHGRDLKGALKLERETMTEIYEIIATKYNQAPKHWVYGHFHDSKTMKYDKTTFHLLGVNEIKELN